MSTQHLILQSPGTTETRAARLAAMLGDFHEFKCHASGLNELVQHSELLQAGAIPIGSVEFVRRAMAMAGIQEPPNLSYPPGCAAFLGRKIERRRAGSVLGRWFVKPVQTKLFNGFIFDTMQDPTTLDPHDQEQHEIFTGLDANTEVLVCEPIDIRFEWRFYIDPTPINPVITWARYDDHPEEKIPDPDLNIVRDLVDSVGIQHPYAADFGMDNWGKTILIEVNDFWSLGLYKGAQSITEKAYLNLLCTRWKTLNLQKHDARHHY